MRRLRGALGMGVTWAIAWAVIGGGIMEAFVDPDGRILDMWPQTLAIPGFVGGVLFSVLFWFARKPSRFDELSLVRFGARGALTGVTLGVLAVSAGLAGDVLPLWLRAAVIVGPVTVLSVVSATGVLAVARVAAKREQLVKGPAAAPDELIEGQRHARVRRTR